MWSKREKIVAASAGARKPVVGRGETTSRGFPKPVDYHDRIAHGRTRLLVLKLTQYEIGLLSAGRGVSGRFCLAKNLDGSYDLIRYAALSPEETKQP